MSEDLKKVCTKCGIEKAKDGFGKRSLSRDGLFSECLVCRSIYAKNRYIENKEHINKINAKWKLENSGKHREINRRWREKNKNRISCVSKKHYLKNRSVIRDNYKKYYQENSAKIIFKSDQWKKSHPEQAKIIRLKSGMKIRKTLGGRLNNSMSAAIWNSLRASKARRKWESLVGYTVDDLKKHLESLFVDGMSWNNYGEWEIDHRVPKSYFKYNTPDDAEFLLCWSLNNLQPLWKTHNRHKRNKLNWTPSTKPNKECYA